MPFSHLDDAQFPLKVGEGELLDFVLANEPNLVFIKDEEGRIVYANNAFMAIYAPDERADIIGSTTVERFTDEEAQLFLSEDRRAMREGRSEIVEEISDWKGEKVVLLTRKIACELSDGSKRLVCISTVITDLAAREKRVVRLNAQLKVYSHTIAHDLKNPIASIISGLSIIDRDSGAAMSERSLMVLKAMQESARGLSGYISTMLKAAAEEAASLDFQPYDLNLLLEEVRFNLSAVIENAEMDLYVARLPTAKIEPNLMRQLFQNLIENSIKHAAAERLVVTIHYSLKDDEHVFFVGDNGVGIPEEKKDQVFTQFFKDGSNEGLGLGLTICQRIANLHDGVMEIHDRVERGCCMVVRIPKR